MFFSHTKRLFSTSGNSAFLHKRHHHATHLSPVLLEYYCGQSLEAGSSGHPLLNPEGLVPTLYVGGPYTARQLLPNLISLRVRRDEAASERSNHRGVTG